MIDFNKIEELKLLAMAREGNELAFGEIVRRYENRIAGIVFGMLGNNQETEDVGQEVFIRFYRKIDDFKGNSKLSTYLSKIAINLSLNELKKRANSREKGIEMNEETHSIVDGTEIEKRFEEKEIVDKALEQLEPEFRSVIVLRLIEGYATKEVAKILDLPLGTVLSRMSRAQKKLKIILEPLIE